MKKYSRTHTYYYYCSRSGYFKTKSTGERILKTQGTSKINSHCTASMIVQHSQDEACIHVRVCYSHYGHSKHLGHLKLSNEDRNHIAGKIAQGVTFERILDDIRNSVGY